VFGWVEMPDARPHRRGRAPLAAALLAVISLLILPPLASANFVYWTNNGGTTIGRAKINGTGVNNSFITGLDNPHGVAVDSKFIYWSQGSATTGSIGRANLDGSGVNPNFIPHTPEINQPFGVTVTPTAVFWGEVNQFIGRANLDGSSPQPQFINLGSAGHSACGITADNSFLYWTDTAVSGAIGRASQAGGAPSTDFISGAVADANCGAAVDNSFIYWSGVGTVGRAAIDGSGATDSFIPAAGGPVGGVAVNSQFLFWVNPTSPTFIGRSNINGSAPNSTFIVGSSSPRLLAAAPSNKITVNSITKKKKKGTATIDAKVPGPGQVTLNQTSTPPDVNATAAAVKQIGLTIPQASSFNLAVKPVGKTAKKLNKQIKKQLKKKHKAKATAKVKVFIHFVPAGVAGVPNTQQVNVTLVKQAKKKK
jgi:hypothetical protein